MDTSASLLEHIGRHPSSNPPPSNIMSNSMPSFLEQFLAANQYFSAGFGLMGVGVGLTALRRSGAFLAHIARRRMLVTLEIPKRDKAFDWFLAWQAKQDKISPASRFIPSHELSVETVHQERPNGSSDAVFNLVAGPGVHWLKYRGAWMQVRRERETQTASLARGEPWETVTLTALSKDRHLFPLMLSQARQLALQDLEGKMVIHTPWGDSWETFGNPRPRRSLSSVVLAAGISDRIISDLKAFLQRKQWYGDRGIPYRRGYLLHGPPGSGKSSFIQALAGALSYDICILNLSKRGLGDDKINHLLSDVPERSFVLIEDVDAAFNKRVKVTADGHKSSTTFSGFLNALDGVASGEERIVFMTTNHIEALDPALIRPGRIDMIEFIDDANPSQAKQLFLQFYEGGSTDTEKPDVVLAKAAEDLELVVQRRMEQARRISMAALQGIFIRHGPLEAVRACESALMEKGREK